MRLLHLLQWLNPAAGRGWQHHHRVAVDRGDSRHTGRAPGGGGSMRVSTGLLIGLALLMCEKSAFSLIWLQLLAGCSHLLGQQARVRMACIYVLMMALQYRATD
jgi:hypothetical protein